MDRLKKPNGILYKIITKTIQGSYNDWDERLLEALCAYKVTTKHTPFQLVYGQEAILSIELKDPFLRIAINERLGDESSLKHCYTILEKVDELPAQAFLNIGAIQQHCKTYYAIKVDPKTLNPNDLVLLYDSCFQNFQENLKCIGPNKVLKSYPNKSMELQDFAGVVHCTHYNGYRLKPYIT